MALVCIFDACTVNANNSLYMNIDLAEAPYPANIGGVFLCAQESFPRRYVHYALNKIYSLYTIKRR